MLTLHTVQGEDSHHPSRILHCIKILQFPMKNICSYLGSQGCTQGTAPPAQGGCQAGAGRSPVLISITASEAHVTKTQSLSLECSVKHLALTMQNSPACARAPVRTTTSPTKFPSDTSRCDPPFRTKSENCAICRLQQRNFASPN